MRRVKLYFPLNTSRPEEWKKKCIGEIMHEREIANHPAPQIVVYEESDSPVTRELKMLIEKMTNIQPTSRLKARDVVTYFKEVSTESSQYSA